MLRPVAGEKVREPRLRLPAELVASLPIESLTLPVGSVRLVDVSWRGLRLLLRGPVAPGETMTLAMASGGATSALEAVVRWRRSTRGGLGEAGLQVADDSLAAWHALLEAHVLPRVGAAAALRPPGLAPGRLRIVLAAARSELAATMAHRLRAMDFPADVVVEPGDAIWSLQADVVVAGPYPDPAEALDALLQPPVGSTDMLPVVLVLVPGAGVPACRQLIEAGAFDCITDEGDVNALEIRLAAALRLREQQRQTRTIIDELVEVSGRDALTGLFNRRQFFVLATDERSRAQRTGEPFALFLVDLDHFKQVNDLYGHQAGDAALRIFSRLVQRHLRPMDVVARYGGEEFVVLLPGTSADGAMMAAERIRALVEATSFDSRGVVHLTASIGLVGSDAPHAVPISPLLDAADRALYLAKHSGRNQVRRGVADLSLASQEEPVEP